MRNYPLQVKFALMANPLFYAARVEYNAVSFFYLCSESEVEPAVWRLDIMKNSLNSRPLAFLPLSLVITGLMVVPSPQTLPVGISSALASPAKVTVKVSVVVIDDLVRKPVPLTNFRVFPAHDSSASQIVRSDEDGVCAFSLMPGNYRFQSVAPLNFKDQILNWSMPFVVNTDETQNVLFTDADASKTGSVSLVGESVVQRGQTNKIEVAEGTKIRVSLGQQLTSNRSKKGDEVRFFLKEALRTPSGEILIKDGASATGTVSYAKGAGGFGKKGKLEFTIESITGADGTQIPLRSTQTAHGKSNILGGAVGIILIAPVMGFIKGKNTRLDVGTQYDAFIDKATWVTPLVPTK